MPTRYSREELTERINYNWPRFAERMGQIVADHFRNNPTIDLKIQGEVGDDGQVYVSDVQPLANWAASVIAQTASPAANALVDIVFEEPA